MLKIKDITYTTLLQWSHLEQLILNLYCCVLYFPIVPVMLFVTTCPLDTGDTLCCCDCLVSFPWEQFFSVSFAFILSTFSKSMGQIFYRMTLSFFFFFRMTLSLGLSHASSELNLVMCFWPTYYPGEPADWYQQWEPILTWLPSSMFCEVILVVRNQPWWEYLHRGHQKMLQMRDHPPSSKFWLWNVSIYQHVHVYKWSCVLLSEYFLEAHDAGLSSYW